MQNVVNAKDDLAAQLRFESFKLGKPSAPKSMSLKHRHSRSHSRNASISSVASLPAPTPTARSSTTSNDSSVLPTTHSMPSLASKRNSHHRRLSSVSTRHESAELMGLPDLPTSSSDDSVHVGEKDSIRRRALWALEGRPDDASYSKVEIPEISTPEIEKRMFDFSSKSSFTAPSASAFSAGNLMASKRDSFKMLGPSSSSKDQLHTLVEEEEEEEDEWDNEKLTEEPATIKLSTSNNDSGNPPTPVSPGLTSATPLRPRPATLALRPLSLTPDIVSTASHGLPTPSSTPGARSGLKSLSLVPSDESATINTNITKRTSLVMNDASPTPYPRARPALNLHISTDRMSAATAVGDEAGKPPVPLRRSSISYKSSSTSSSVAGLPTPEMTPTFSERRFSHNSLGSSASASGFSTTSNSDEDFFPPSSSSNGRHRPLSAHEQHFLFKSHNALLSRIQDLERALSVRRTSISSSPSRPVSSMSSLSVADSEASEPSDEMFQLVADLKSERDELKRDVDGWRVRVGDLEKQIAVLGKRVEGERREAWVARSRVSLLEMEKSTLEKELGHAKAEMRAAEEENAHQVEDLKAVIRRLEEDKAKAKAENERLASECDKLKAEKEGMATPTVPSFPSGHSDWRRGLQYASLDSLESATDVDFGSFDGDHQFGFALKAVEEEQDDMESNGSQIPVEDVEEDYLSEEEDSGLAGYEDEEDSDLSFQSPGTSSSYGSVDEMFNRPRSLDHLKLDVPMSPITPVSPLATRSLNAPPSSSSSSGTTTPSTLTPSTRSPSASPAPDGLNAFKFPRTVAPTPAPAPVAVPAAAPMHKSIGSISKTWTFPRGPAPSLFNNRLVNNNDDVDRFFDCLEDSETDSTGSRSPVSPSVYTYEHNKGLFAKGLEAFDDADGMPFELPPSVVGMIVEEEEEQSNCLSIIEEDEEDEDEDEETRVDDKVDQDDMFSGIKFTFTPAPEDEDEYPSPQFHMSDDEYDDDEEEEEEAHKEDVEEEEGEAEEEVQTPQTIASVRKPVPFFEEFGDGNEDDVPFNFGRPLRSSTPPKALALATPPRAHAQAASPSSIPRPSSSTSFTFPSSIVDSSPSPSKLPIRMSSVNGQANAFATPPTKRGGAMPSFIPQPVLSSPTPLRTGPSLREKPAVAFMRQPSRRPLLGAKSSGPNDSNGSAFIQSQSPKVSFFGSIMTIGAPRSSDRSVDGGNSDFFASQQSHPGARSATGGDGLKSIDLGSSTAAATFLPATHSDEHPSHPIPASLSSPSSLSSLMTSPKLSFQTLAGFIPRPWSSSTSHNHDHEHDAVLSSPMLAEKPKLSSAQVRYVSKEKQVERLRLRFQRDGSSTRLFSDDVCQKCDGATVYL